MANDKTETPQVRRARGIAALEPRKRAKAIASVLNRDILREAYSDGKNLSRYLETLDPSDKHPMGSGDAFNRVLAARGIRTRSIPELGIAASTLEDVVNDERAQYLATEIFARAYRKVIFGNGTGIGGKTRAWAPIMSGEGVSGSAINQPFYPPVTDLLLRPAIPLSEVVGVTSGIRGTYFKPFFLEDVSQANSRVAEAAEIPAVKITTSERAVDLNKYGRRIDLTYESDRRIPVDLLSFYVERIAIAVEAEKLAKVIGVIVNGDGNSGTAATSYNLDTLNGTAGVGVFNLEGWLNWKMTWANPLMMTTVLGNSPQVLKTMLLDTGSANIPLVAGSGVIASQTVTPINQGLADGIRVGWTTDAPANTLVGFDKRLAIQRLFEIGSNIQETAKNVKSQINSLVLSEVEGYAVIDPKASKVLVMNA